jgi:integrase
MLWELFYQTGGRVSEIVALNRQDVQFGDVNLVQLHGKGRKQRPIVLHQGTATRLKHWLEELAIDRSPRCLPTDLGRVDIVPAMTYSPNVNMTANGVEQAMRLAEEQERQSSIQTTIERGETSRASWRRSVRRTSKRP